MNYYNLMPLYGSRTKYAGFVICIICITLFFFTGKLIELPFLQSYTERECITLLMMFNGIALYLIAFSRERNEDERVSIIRDKTFRVSFAAVISGIISVTVIQLFFLRSVEKPTEIPVTVMYMFFMFLINVGLVFQLVIFYYRIYTNSNVSSYDFTVGENIRKNKKLYIAYVILYIAGLLALVLL